MNDKKKQTEDKHFSYELPKQKAQTQAKMFQFMKSKRKGRRK